MSDLFMILNKDDVAEDMETIQQTHKDFIFPSAPDSSDIAIQTLQALAHSCIKQDTHHHSTTDYDNKHTRTSSRSPPTLRSSWPKLQCNSPSPTTPPTPTTPSNSSRRDYKKKDLVVRPELMQMKQAKAAVKLGIPPSTFSKRWRESLPDRKWPYRIHKKVEKSIQMLKGLQQKGHDVTTDLRRLMNQRELNLKPAVITMFEDVNEVFDNDLPSFNSSPSSTSPSSPSSPTATSNNTANSSIPTEDNNENTQLQQETTNYSNSNNTSTNNSLNNSRTTSPTHSPNNRSSTASSEDEDEISE